MKLSTYWHTGRYLRPVQVYGRIWRHLHNPEPDLRPAAALAAIRRPWQPLRWRQPSLLSPSQARFLNDTRDISSPSAWTAADAPRLWLYNLHYFDDLTSIGADARRRWHLELIERWIAENAPGVGPGWEPYPVSLRVVNWIKTLWSSAAEPRPLPASAVKSLAVQVRWLRHRLEHHLQANHLWANAKALVMAGACFEGPEAAAWWRTGARLLFRELREQVLADGGHYERSPMYHAVVLEDVLDVVQLGSLRPDVFSHAESEELRGAAARMLRWLRVMTHPDGDISFFNDAAFGVAARHDALARYARDLGVTVETHPLGPLEWLRESGYIRLEQGPAVLVCDVAPIGPDHQPAHAHADTLSFELSLHGRRVIVNSGTSTYAPGPDREFQRSTHAHNTVEVNRRNSSEVWGAFRVARRAGPSNVGAGATPLGGWARGTHDGYSRLAGRVMHSRQWDLDSDRLRIVDTLSGSFADARVNLLLAPQCRLDTDFRMTAVPTTGPLVEAAHWFPEFGLTRETSRVTVPLTGHQLETEIRWS